MSSVRVFPTGDVMASVVAERMLIVIHDALSTRGRADVVLTGGTSGGASLAAAASSPLAPAIDWTSVHVWWGDERFVTAGDPDRNEGQAQDALLASLPLPEENIHRMGSSDDYASAEDAAAAYVAEITEHGNPAWDLAMFGVGPDGHVASLFPGHEVFSEQMSGADVPDAVAVHDSPKPPPTRVTLTLQGIARARRVWLLAAGAGKADAVAQAMRPDSALPASAVRGVEETLWMLDAEAAARL